MNPLTILINKKLYVENKVEYNKAKYPIRCIWKTVFRINPEDSINIFNNIKTDADFCKWLYENVGPGIFLAKAFRKGKKGFWNFMKVELKEDGYCRLQKRETMEDKEIKENLQERTRLQRQLKSSQEYPVAPDIIQGIKERVEELNEDINLNKELKNIDKSPGCSEYLKSVLPIYQWHGYNEVPRETFKKIEQITKPVIEEVIEEPKYTAY